MNKTAAPTRLYPLFADLRGRDVLIVGGGDVAARKCRALLEAGARVRVAAPLLGPALTAHVRSAAVSYRAGPFDERALDGAWLVVAATGKDIKATLETHLPSANVFVIDGILDDPEGAEAGGTNGEGAVSGEADPLYDQAVQIVLQNKRASISLVQRHLRIGYNRAARLIEDMERAGLVSAMATNGNREILVPSREK